MSAPGNHFYEFGPFHLDTQERQLLRDGKPVALTPKAYEMLLALVQKSGHIVAKDELLKEVWPDSFVNEGNLTQHVFSLRRALGENANERHYIETIPRRGYRFIASVRELATENGKEVAEPQTRIGAEAEGHFVGAGAIVVNSRKGAEAPSQRKTWHSRSALGLIIALVVLAAALVLLWNRSRTNEAVANLQVTSIGVLPFKPITAGESDESLGVGMASAVVTKLLSIKKLTIRPATAVSGNSEARKGPVEIGRELQVDAVLDGKIQRAGERIRVTAQLINTKDGSTVWSESFDERFTDLFAVQDEIAGRVAAALALKITPSGQERISKRYPHNPEAYQKYLLGRYFFDRSGIAGAVAKSIDYYQQAINLEPRFALAYAGLADAYSFDLAFPSSPAGRIEAHDKVQAAALKALELDGTLAEAHTTLGRLAFFDWDWQSAEREYQRAIELDPDSAIAHFLLGWYLVVKGRSAAGIAELRRALELDPLSVNINITLGAYLTTAGQYDEAIEQLQKTVALNPTSPWPRIRLAQAYEMKGDRERSISEFQQAMKLFTDSGGQGVGTAEIRLAQAYAFWGNRAEALRIIDKVRQKPETNSDYDIALIYAGLGRSDRAFEILDRVYEKHNMNLLSILTDPRLGDLRSDPRYSKLMQRLGLSS